MRAAGAFGAAASLLRAFPPGGRARWTRTNHRGEPVSLLEGPAWVAGAVGGILAAGTAPGRTRAAGLVAAVSAGAFGAVDDLAEHGSSKGLRGHLRELRHGRVTTGTLKILGLGAGGLAAAALLGADDPSLPESGRLRSALCRGGDLAVRGALVAGTANLANLFDLRPGRALKLGLLAAPAALPATDRRGSAVLVAAAVGSCAAGLGDDLGERTMLGDTGANALGAVLGTALAARAGRRGRLGALAVVTALTLASEQISFTRVIEATPGLREFDALGRRPR